MNQRDRDVVDAIRDQLAKQVGADRFALWFEDGVRLNLRQNRLHVSVTDAFRLDRIRRFQADIAQAAEHVLQSPVELRFTVEAAAADEPESAEAASSADGPPRTRRTSRPAKNSASRRRSADNASHDASHDGTASRQDASSLQDRASGRGRGRRIADGPRPVEAGAAAGCGRDQANVRVARKPNGFETFVEGDGNRVALTAARSTLRRLGRVSPLLVYGPSGTGKSHLLECIRAEARAAAPRLRIVSLSAEQFTSAFLEALQGSGLPSFRRKYRDVQLLLIDDIHFFRGKRATLVELQHTIDGLQRSGGQLVLATDRPPGDRSGFGQELMNRLSGGLVCRIDPPDYDTRRQILTRMAAELEVALPADVLEYLAAKLPGDARQLRGALYRLEAASLALKSPLALKNPPALKNPLTVDAVSHLLDDLLRASRPIVRLDDINRAVCDVFGLDGNTLQSNRKARHVSHPRMLAMFLARKHTRSALSEIGHYFGNRTHSTVISAQKKVHRWLNTRTGVRMAHGECSVEDAIRQVEIRLGTA